MGGVRNETIALVSVLKLRSSMLHVLTTCVVFTACIDQPNPILNDQDSAILDHSISDAEVMIC